MPKRVGLEVIINSLDLLRAFLKSHLYPNHLKSESMVQSEAPWLGCGQCLSPTVGLHFPSGEMVGVGETWDQYLRGAGPPR